MNIPVTVLLDKMTKQLIQLQQRTNEGSLTETKLREEMNVIKAYCELILDQEVRPVQMENRIQILQPQASRSNSVPAAQGQGAPYKEEDANGDSLFDF